MHYLAHPKKNSIQFNEFLRPLLESKRDRKVILVMDNASFHRTQKTFDLLAEHKNVFVLWLPKYSPELNAIEGLWGYLKRSGLNNYFYQSVEQMETAMDEVFADLNRHPETTLSLTYRISNDLRKSA